MHGKKCISVKPRIPKSDQYIPQNPEKKNPIPNGLTDEINYGPRAVRLLGQEVDGNEESNPLRMLITTVLDLRVLLRQFRYPDSCKNTLFY